MAEESRKNLRPSDLSLVNVMSTLAVWDDANSGGIVTIVEVAYRSAITATSLGRYCWNDVGKMPDSWLPVTVLL
jgi:hypothetical protein